MDFFEAQARAKKRTSRLVILFLLALAGTIAAAYFAAIFALNQTRDFRSGSGGYYDYTAAAPPLPLWQPQVLAVVGLGTLLVVGLASLFKWGQFSAGGSAVAQSVGGRKVDPHTTDLRERRLLNVVEEMAIASGVPLPAVYILESEPAINAFAAGLTTSDAVVAVTRGTVDKLSRDELQGVVGHEFSHILNGDMRLNLRLGALLFGILFLGLAGRGVLWSLRGARFSSRRDKNSGGVVAAIAVAGLALLIIGYIGYFFGRLIQAAVSRQREFLADASSVQFTRNPAGLTGALKKIGGFALGSALGSNRAAAIGHFFFAQGFRSRFGGLWATHPPLATRIRAIDPQFDGKMFVPPEVVDVAHESFVAAGLARPRPPAIPVEPLRAPSLAPAIAPAAAIAAIGALAPEHIAAGEALLASVPPRVREAARSPADAPVLLYGLLLDADPALRARQRSLVAGRAGAQSLQILDELDPALRALGPEHRLPLVQLALPALRTLPPTALRPMLETLDELIRADTQVSPFEFALKKIVTRSLALGRAPAAAVVQIYSFRAVTAEIGIVLSALAHASADADSDARSAFAAGAAQIKLIEPRLTFLAAEACSPDALEPALDRLAVASGPIKQRTLVAAAHVVGADGKILLAEAELLRAVAALLDCPIPPLVAAA
jgi:Zn-dependent protease with chaperone function